MSFLHFVWALKHLISVAGLFVFWIIDRNLGPGEEYFPFRAKILLVICVLIPYFYTVNLSSYDRRAYFPIILIIFVVSFLAYGGIKRGFEYIRLVTESGHGTAGVSYRQEMILGGFLRKVARYTIKKDRISPQIYLEGVQYNPDLVWTRSSSVMVMAALVLTYIVSVTAFLGTVAVAIVAAEVAEVTTQQV